MTKRDNPAILLYLLPRVQDIVFIMIFLLGITLGPRFFGDGDLGRHIVVGKIILTEHHIPRLDVFSYTQSGQLLTTTEWLSEAFYAAAWLGMGLNGVVLLAVALVAVTFTLTFREIVKKSGSYFVGGILVFIMLLGTLFHWLARPHLFTWLAFAIWVPAVDRLSRGEKVPLWQFPLLMLVWANLHGGFVIGFLVWGAYLGGWVLDKLFAHEAASFNALKRLLIVGGLAFLATLLNPSGLGLWGNVLGHVGDKTLMSLQIDWHSPDFHSPNTWPFVLWIAVTLFALARQKPSLTSGRALLTAGLTTLGLYSVRNIPFVMIACAPFVGSALSQEFSSLKFWGRLEMGIRSTQKNLRGAAWSLVTVIVIVVLLLSGKTLDAAHLGNTFNPAHFPVQAVDWLESHPQPGNMFNEFTWGGYLLYRLWPAYNVFIDGQTDFYGPGLVREYLTVLNARDGWKSVLALYNAQWVLVPPDTPLAQALLRTPAWIVLYEDQAAVILRNTVP